MKYIKKFENVKIYNIGDYLKIELENTIKNPYPIVKILNIYHNPNSYVVEFINQTTNKISTNTIFKKSDIIKRLATEYEIEKYEEIKHMLKNLNKYNL